MPHLPIHKALLILLATLLLAACALPPALRPTPERPAPPPTPRAEPRDEASPPKPPPAPTRAPTLAPPTSLPTSTPFDISWNDRSIFAPGLISTAQSALSERPGASVYHLDLTLSDDLTHLTGREEVRYTNTETAPLAEIAFRLFPNLADGSVTVSDLVIDGAPVTPRYELRNSAMLVPLPRPLPRGEQTVIGMNFAVDIPTEPGGNYGAFALLDGILALAHFYPMIPAYDDEGWNIETAPTIGDVVYADSSYFLVRLNAPAGQTVLTSGREIDRQQQNGRALTTFAAGPVRDFYIVSSDRFDKVSEKIGETTIDAYAPQELASENKQALRTAAAAFKTYSQRLGDYPFTELDVVATPTLAGGIEYPGLVVVATAIYDPSNPFFEAATAHEIGHQWFYSTVGNDQVDEPWLDESLTQYITMLYYQDAYGQNGYDGFRQSLTGRWERADGSKIPIGLPVRDYSESDYSAIVYGRGPLFFETLANKMGQTTFDAFLHDYYRTFKWDIATTDGLKKLAEKHCTCDLTPLFKEWVYAN